MAATSTMPAYLLPGVPVYQPSHLEGDASLATEILPGPPSLLSVQQATQKRDPKKPVYSYLHPTDPGTTYSGVVHGTIITEEGAMNLKGKRSAVTGRAQRASARNHNGNGNVAPDPFSQGEAGASSQAISIAPEQYTMVVDDDESLPSRSNSTPDASGAVSDAKPKGKGRSKGKAKAKEVDPAFRVKEEPRAVSLQTPQPEPFINAQINNNEDHCSSCRSHGALVYCDGCPRAFHLWCLNPPMEHIDDSDSHWFCPACVVLKHPPRKPPHSLFAPLIHLVQTSIPTEFQLPEEIRTFFKDVGTGPKGTYLDNSVLRQPRPNRFGLPEERDAHRLRDKNGGPVLCFKCGTSALPPDLAAAAPAAKRARRVSTRYATETSKSIVSCDYCNLHWHLDCLDPPLSTMPPFNKKWMCPNHAEQVKLPKLRIPKQAAAIEITKPRQPNNGNIEIIHPQTASTSHVKKVAVEEVLINGRRYRVPERIVVLDFWNKVSTKVEKEPESDMSSPLTSLSSLEDPEEDTPAESLESSSTGDLRLAQMLCDFRLSRREYHHRPMEDRSVQTESDSARAARTPKASPVKKTNGQPPSTSNLAEAGPSTSTAKRKRTANGVQAVAPASRELRPRRQTTSFISVSSKESSMDPFVSTPSRTAVRVKVEEPELGIETLAGTSSPKHTTSTRGRLIRRPSQRGGLQNEDPPPKRGRKRKDRDDDAVDDDERDRAEAVEQLRNGKEATEGKGKGKGKQKEKAPPTSTTGAPPPTSSTTTTPSLKIRLPRLSDIASTSKSSDAP
ncbi:hypothetical protein FB45DRAFT_791280 [Roridomyces roridus]|uniref:PHD-type domain-containing protein n=1 Tax=Roridomyces roridus TaxID=1738132 RepID=A0AAD7BVZ4_9AGAR|nr:hypothetical protein FB45DRAFT_791280 [Roridomyces roridus]